MELSSMSNSAQPHSAHAPTGPCKKKDAMPSLIALKQPLKHYLKMLVVLMIFASGFGFMFAVAETTRGRYRVEIPEIQKSVTVSMVDVVTGSKAAGLKTTNITSLP
jgi:hypothetical protein